MKKICILISLFIAVTSCKGGEQNKLKRYEVKSGIIHYTSTTSGKMMGSAVSGSGTESLYFTDWGAVELSELQSTQTSEIKFFGKTKTKTDETHTINKLDNGDSYSVDFDRKTITLSRDAAMEMMMQTNTDAGDAGKSMLESMGGKKIGEEKYQTYDCEIWEVIGIKQWIYKGLTLKTEATVMGIKTITEATSIELNVSVPDKNFKLPDFPIQEVDGYMSNETYNNEMEELDKGMEQMQNLSYEEWKKMVTENDPEMQAMSEEELHQTYDMMQKMIKARIGE
jgi:hypothetical protein